MEQWERMFAGVQRIIWESVSLQDGMNRVRAFAAQYPDDYDKPDYWQKVAATPMPFDTVIGWVREGCAAFAPDATHKTALLVLDCGDCPDIFRLQECHLSQPVDIPELTEALRGQPLLDAYNMEKHLHLRQILTLTEHNVEELQHPILSWYQPDNDFHGDDGYLLWITVAALAWRECLRDTKFCQTLLKSCDQLFMLVGYEEIFFYLGMISAQGLEF